MWFDAFYDDASSPAEGDEIAIEGKKYPTSEISMLLQLSDKLIHYGLASLKNDVLKINADTKCIHRTYELKRVSSLLGTVQVCSDSIEMIDVNHQNKKMIRVVKREIESLSDPCNVAQQSLEKERDSSIIWAAINELVLMCEALLLNLDEFITKMKSRAHEFTDAGPGAGITNHDVKFRAAETIMIFVTLIIISGII